MTDTDLDARRAKGAAVYARTLGVPATESVAALATRTGAAFADEALLAAGGAAWSHPGLTDRDRSIAVITALTAQGVTGDRLTTHLHRAHDEGLDVDALTGLMVLLASYLGYPKASLAMETVHHMDR